MNPERYRKIKEIFNQAAEMTVAERGDFLADVCDSDTLKREIEKMLVFADEEESEDALEKNAFEIFSGSGASEQKIPEKIGAYKILREIGRGGMGAVYEAVREADDFTQKVALKVIKRGMDTDAILRRFRHEQKILATLEHPNIARFLDGGMTAEGQPFYAMEFVEGEFIDDYCRERNLSINERLQLFRQVCSAVQYAHQNLVIHRDLKSKNILVTADGAPKLLDFGIAKVLTPETAEEIGTATQLGMMTPAYASPEQILGKRIGTASDVYSLGVILYELLTGQKPYRISSHSQIEIEKAVLHDEPARPSSVVGSKSKTRIPESQNKVSPDTEQKTNAKSAIRNPQFLKGDLDNIILKALRKDAAQRYPSVGQFSEDIRRYLEGLPVQARPHTFSYRATKFIRRNRLAVTAAALIFLSLCAGITMAIWQAHRAQQQRILAEKRFDDVRQLANSVVFKYHDAIADLEGSTAVREMLVKDALQYLDALTADAVGDNELKKELALAYLKLGDAQGKIYAANIGDTGGALASYQKSVALFEEVAKDAPADAKAKIGLIKAYDSLAFLMMRTGGNSAELVEKSLNLYDELEKIEPADDERRMQLVELLIRYGDTRNGFENSLREHLKALAVAEKLIAGDPNNTEKLRQFIRANQRIGTDYQRLGDKAGEENKPPDEAGEFFRRALEYHRRMLAATEKLYALAPEKPANRRYLALAYINLSDTLVRNGSADEALEMLGKAQKILEENLRRDPQNSETKFDLAEIFDSFAGTYQSIENHEKFSQYLQKALALSEETYARDPKNLEVLRHIIERTERLMNAHTKMGEHEKAKYFKQKNEEFKAKQSAVKR